MQKKSLLMGFVLLMTSNYLLKAQYASTDGGYKKWFVGTSLFVILGNLDRENPPDFVEFD